jgi:hypothetical protein
LQQPYETYRTGRVYPAMNTVASLPYGTCDLDPEVHVVSTSPLQVRCYVHGCRHTLRTPTRYVRGEICPAHGIRCHLSRYGLTYSYSQAHRNIIASPDLFASRLVGHPFKYESHRLGLENSEDALTWNVFRSFQEVGCLHQVANRITGLGIQTEPILFLWGICLTGDTFKPWDLLIAARTRFEARLPVDRPLTEPDIALYLPGRYLIVIEAKFTSPNTFYCHGRRRDPTSLTKVELLDTYGDPSLQILDVDRARTAERVYYQLWRNMVFAEWMAGQDGRTTRAYHASLTRAGWESESCDHFHQMVRHVYRDRFVHVAWEDLCWLCAKDSPRLERISRYLATKTAGLKGAFRIEKA